MPAHSNGPPTDILTRGMPLKTWPHTETQSAYNLHFLQCHQTCLSSSNTSFVSEMTSKKFIMLFI